MNLQVDEQKLVGIAASRNRVLYFQPAEHAAPMRHFAEQLVRQSGHQIVEQAAPIRLSAAATGAEDLALSAWQALASQFISSSLGMIAETGGGLDAILQLLRSGGEVPGAIALIGFDDRLSEGCLRLANDLDCSFGAPQIHKGKRKRVAGSIPFEWPSLMIFLPAGDTDLAACARACREMRAAGIPILLEVMDASLGLGSALVSSEAIAELVQELDNHFSVHLAPAFPRLM